MIMPNLTRLSCTPFCVLRSSLRATYTTNALGPSKKAKSLAVKEHQASEISEAIPNGNQPKVKTARKGQGKPTELPQSHIDVIRVLESRRFQLRNQIKVLREKERLKISARKTRATVKATAVPEVLDIRLAVLSKLNIDTDQLEQDHLSNVSDFRIQAKPALKIRTEDASKKKPKKKKSRPEDTEAQISRKKADEAKIAAQEELDSTLRTMNLHHLNSNLKAYINVCSRVDMVDAAVSSLGYYRDRFPGEQDRKTILDVHVYNLILNLYAKRERIHDVKKVFRWMKTDGVRPNAKSFAHALETLSRAAAVDLKMANQILQQMNNEGISCNDLFTECNYILDEREKVLTVVKSVHPHFEPTLKLPHQMYQPEILSSLNEPLTTALFNTPYQGVIPYNSAMLNLDQQIGRELDGVITVRSVDPLSEPDAKTIRSRAKLNEVKAYWTKILTESFERNKNMIRHQHRPRAINIYPFLCSLTTKEYVDIMLQEVIQLGQASEGYSPSTLVLNMQTGRKAMEKYLINCKLGYQLVDRTRKLYTDYLKYFEDNKAVSEYNCRQYWQKLEHDLKLSMSAHLGDHLWPKSVILRVGKFLYDIIINDVKINTTILRPVENSQYAPAIYKVYRHYGDILKEEVKPHPILAKLFKASVSETLDFESVMCPMIIPPLPWVSTTTGGYLLRNSTFVRLPDGPGAGKNVAATEYVPAKQLNPVFDSINQLGASPWIINKPMLDLLIQVFRNKGMPEVDVPPPVSVCPPLPKITKDLSPEERIQVYRERFQLKRKKNEMFSLWCDSLYKLSIANHFRDAIFWFPHNVDFRGRVYPIPPHFHHLCGDMARSLLLFAKGMPLGEKGLDWLKIHVINLTGLKKKSSIADRLAYANEIIDDILDSADDPLNGKQWWKKSDDPWQTLACCKEIAAVMRSPDPASFISRYPIHQDGSCNGLQHYAALGRDQKGAEQVNLVPFDTPQDVYNGVASLVENQRAIDAANGIEIAKALEGFVGRKVVKQTVMTIVYGVTRYGARGQIRGQLQDIKELDQKKTWAGASYLAAKTFDSIKQMFTATRKIQDWFVDCARLISSVREKPVQWVTPVGFPVVQPYFKNKHGHDRNTMHTVLDPGKPNTMKQKNAFPPNFIHSLDSTHMMLTSLHAARAGITFVSVHDCYWTHPVTVHIMNKICREQFVAMHSLPILTDLSAHFMNVYGYDEKLQLPSNDPRMILNETLKAIPEKGTFKLESVLDSVYFFS